jgi:predicted ATPase/class 3 adenylate cyclase
MPCPQCGATNAEGQRFCGACGAALTAPGAVALVATGAVPAESAGERRNLVVLFSDILDSTALSLRLDPEEWREVLADYYRASEAAVSRFGGHLAKYLGDGVLAYFGWPSAHENDPERAVRAGLALRDGMSVVNSRLAGRNLPALQVRISIHAGEVVVSPAGEVFGDVPNVAAHIQSLAAPDRIVATAPIVRSAARRFAVADLGDRPVKGADQPLRLYEIRGLRRGRSAAALPAGPFVGRRESLATLLEAWKRARQGRGEAVTIIGEPGIGKSRLVDTLREHIAGEPHIWLRFEGTEFSQGTPFHPVVQLLSRLVVPDARRPVVAPLGRLERLLRRAGVDAAQAVAPMAEMLGLDDDVARQPGQAGERRKVLVQTLAAWALNMARRRPAVIVIEDLHWLDPSTLDLVQALIAVVQHAPVLLLLTARRTFRAPWLSSARIGALELARLTDPEIREIALAAAPALSGRDEIVRTIIARADGNPMFAEELARLVESRSPDAVLPALPETLAGSLQARLDQLGSAREVVQFAAVIGDALPAALLAAVMSRSLQGLAQHLARLVEADILLVSHSGGETSYHFKHTLIRDAAYGSLLRRRGRELHERVASTIAQTFRHIAESRPELVARHLSAAGLHEAAVTAWERAAIAFAQRGAYREAESAYRQALSDAAALPAQPAGNALRLHLQNALVGVLQLTHGYSARETAEAAARARELLQDAGSDTQMIVQVGREWAAASSAGRYLEARILAERFQALAASIGTRDSLANAHLIQMTSLYRLGDLAGAERHFESGQPLFDDSKFAEYPGAVAQTFGNAARNAWMLGRPDEARRRIQHAMHRVQAGQRPYDIAFAQYMAAILAMLMREAETARSLAEESISLSDRHAFPQFAAISRIVLGRALADLGQPEEGLALIRHGIAAMEQTGSRVALTLYLAWQAEAEAAAGKTACALASIGQALTANPEERFFAPELLRIRGELLEATGERDAAENDLRQALSLARDMNARWLELRAAISLRQLPTADGSSILAAAWARIREGHDTPDARTAKALLA